MRRLYSPPAICFVVFALAAVCAAWPRAAARPVAIAKATYSQPPGKTLGVASCASMACHNGNGPKGTKGSEYSTWITVDPHANAYQALFKEESQRMHTNLARDPHYSKYKSANKNPLCLKCHGMGDGATAVMHADGVGCERCHGPAEHWKATHYLDGFDRNTPGFKDLRDLEARARTCVQCHVGDDKQEVNHDLIAAGHPRLRFEFAAYHSIYPKHWADTGEKSADPGFEARAWVLGQLISAQAALELLAARTKGVDPITKEAKPWPEFSEYECAACHHGLRKPSFRQERDLKKATAGEKVASGSLPWGTWYYTLLPLLEKRMPVAEAKKLKDLREALNLNLRKRFPPQDTVARDARAAADLIDAWIAKVKTQPLTRKEVSALLRALAKEDAVVQSGWDGGAQVYLGLAASHHALCDLDPEFKATTPLKASLIEMRNILRNSFGESRPLYDSPLKYDPEKVADSLKTIRKRVK